MAILIYDNKNNLSFYNLKTPYIKNINYSKIFKFREINGFQIYKSSNWRCYDFKEICINSEKEKYKIEKKLGYFSLFNCLVKQRITLLLIRSLTLYLLKKQNTFFKRHSWLRR